VEQETFQGDLLSVPVRVCSQGSISWYHGELWFYDNCIIPLAKKLRECGVFGVSSHEYLNYAKENGREWASKAESLFKLWVSKYKEPTVEPKLENAGDVELNQRLNILMLPRDRKLAVL
jgi:hypothetical protein